MVKEYVNTEDGGMFVKTVVEKGYVHITDTNMIVKSVRGKKKESVLKPMFDENLISGSETTINILQI